MKDLVRLSKGFQKALYCTSSSKSKFQDVYQLGKLWDRIPIAPMSYSSEQVPISVSRTGATHMKCIYGLQLFRAPNVIFSHSSVGRYKNDPVHMLYARLQDGVQWLMNKAFVRLRTDELPSKVDLLNGCKQIFFMIAKAYRSRDFSQLRSLTVGRNVLDIHQKAASKLTETQRNGLNVTEQDLAGLDGFLLNWNGFTETTSSIPLSEYIFSARTTRKAADGTPLDHPVVVYKVGLFAIYQKNYLYRLIQPYPISNSREQLHVRLPKPYGFKRPRYTVIHIEICQEEAASGKLDSEIKLYDFHVHSF